MDAMYEYHGDISVRITEEGRGKVLRFLRGDEVITEIHLSPTGADRLGLELLRARKSE